MAKIELSDSKTKAKGIDSALKRLRKELDRRKELWSRLTPEQRAALIRSGKDPVLTQAWDMLVYLGAKDLFNIEIGRIKRDVDL